LSIGDQPLLMKPDRKRPDRAERGGRADGKRHRDGDGERPRQGGSRSDLDSERYRIEVGHDHGVKAGNIMGAIANEAGIDGAHIGHIDIQSEYSLVDLPVGMPREVFNDLRKTRVCGQALMISREGDEVPAARGGGKSAARDKPRSKVKPKAKSRGKRNATDNAKPSAKRQAKDKAKDKAKPKPRTKKKHAARAGERRKAKTKS
jgi:ATP-dependent RNA helicase DeaD